MSLVSKISKLPTQPRLQQRQSLLQHQFLEVGRILVGLKSANIVILFIDEEFPWILRIDVCRIGDDSRFLARRLAHRTSLPWLREALLNDPGGSVVAVAVDAVADVLAPPRLAELIDRSPALVAAAGAGALGRAAPTLLARCLERANEHAVPALLRSSPP